MKYKLLYILFGLFFCYCACDDQNDINVEPKIEPSDTTFGDTSSIIIDTVSQDTIEAVFYFKEANRPFPQHSNYYNEVLKPAVDQSEMDQTVIDFYRKWKARYLKAMNDTQYYVHYTLEYKVGNAVSCSEGHGFGMVITALMAGVDSTSYDDFIKLYNFYDTHRSGINSNLMAWQQNELGQNSSGADSATDGDLDIAYALLLAHKQWGSDGVLNFLKQAELIIEAIYESDISKTYKQIELGDWVHGGKYARSARPCDFMIDHMRSFSNFTGDNKWHEVIDTTYNIINTVAHVETGFLPDFVIHSDSGFIPCPPNFLESIYDGEYYYNSCRAPWRIAMDYIVSGDNRARESLNRINKWLSSSTNLNAGKIKGGYYLNGEAINTWSDMAFTAPFGVCAMVDEASGQQWLDEMWRQINSESISSGAYFGNSIKMICIITMSGNWWAPY